MTAIGVDAVQIREKDLDARRLLELGLRIADALAPTVALLVNGRFDIALAIGAAGVHLPSRALPIARIRERCPRLVIGASTHRTEEVAAARDAGADYVTFGPVYPPRSKTAALPAVGRSGLARAVDLGLPVLALGGVSLERLEEIAGVGAAGVAAIGAFHSTEEQARAFVAAAHRLFPARAASGESRP